MTYYVRFALYVFLCFLSFDVAACPTENDLETNSTESSETHLFDHWDGVVDRSDRSRYLL